MLDRYHTTPIGSDEEALRAAFLKCGELMKVRGCAVMGLAVHTKHNLDGVIRSVFGEDAARVKWTTGGAWRSVRGVGGRP